jgi:CBS domain-containing protein
MKRLCNNALTTVGTNQFVEHTQLMTVTVRQAMRKENPLCTAADTVKAAIVKMTESRLGAVTLVGDDGGVVGVFTDGDLRRKIQESGSDVIDMTLAKAGYSESPISISADVLLYDAVAKFEESKVDTIVVLDGDKPIGILDVQDVV